MKKQHFVPLAPSLFLPLLILLIFQQCKPAGQLVDYEKADLSADSDVWTALDSLYEYRHFIQAGELLAQIEHQARSENNKAAYILSRWKFWQSLSVHRYIPLAQVISEARAEINKASELEKSLLALGYASWIANTIFMELSGSISERQDVSQVDDNPDKWSLNKWNKELTDHLQIAVSNAKRYNRDAGEYALLIQRGENTPWFGNSMFELVSIEAIQLFENSHLHFDQIRPHALQLSKDWFLPAGISKIDLPEQEDNSIVLISQLYYDLMANYNAAKRTDAWLDINLRRLNWVYQHSVHSDKDQLYKEQLETTYHANSESIVAADYAAALAEWYANRVNWQAWSHVADISETETATAEKESAFNWIKAAHQKFPASRGALKASRIEETILQQNLNLTTESVYLPSENPLVLLTYRNRPEIHARLYKLPADLETEIPNDWKEAGDFLQKYPLIQEYQWNLSGGTDHFEHRIEQILERPGSGRYALVVSNNKEMFRDSASFAVSGFYVSNLAITSRREVEQTEFRILSRASGIPLNKVKLSVFESMYSRYDRKFDFIGIEDLYTNTEGRINYSRKAGQSFKIMAVYQGDTLIPQEQFYAHAPYFTPGDQKPEVSFFTDRSLYRAGQKVWFKGLVIQRDKNSIPKIVPSQSVLVSLYDVNNQIVANATFISDQFGSIHGMLEIPERVLNGIFSLRADIHGQTQIRVEDFRPPGFEITFDEQTDALESGDTALISGVIKTYTEIPLAGALVRYEISQIRWPFYGGDFYLPPGGRNATPFEYGETYSDQNGNFSIAFKLPVSTSANPGFRWSERYQIKVTVQDLGGETLEKTTIISPGQAPVEFQLNAPEIHSTDKALSITGKSNLPSRAAFEGDIQVVISKLIAPEGIWKSRLWERPNQISISKDEYNKLLPGRPFGDDLNPDTWEVASIIKDTFFTASDFEIKFPAGMLSTGFYRIETTLQLANKMLSQKKHSILLKSPEQVYQHGIDRIIIQTSANRAVPGSQVNFQWLFPPHIQHFRFELSHNERLLDVREGSVKDFKNYMLDIKPEHRGNVHYHFIAIAEGRLYTSSGQIEVPWADKTLQVTWLEFDETVLPGQQGRWVLRVTDHNGKPVRGQFTLSAYDHSLDAINPHQWERQFFPSYQGLTNYRGAGFEASYGYWRFPSYEYHISQQSSLNFTYDKLKTGQVDFAYGNIRLMSMRSNGMAMSEIATKEQHMETDAIAAADMSAPEIREQALPEIREQFEPLSIFETTQESDHNGMVRIPYQMQESLSRWKVLGFVHTQDLQYLTFENLLTTKKQVMIEGTWPRFLRQGDEMVLNGKISNTTNEQIMGIASFKVHNKLSEDQPEWLLEQAMSQRVAVPANSTVYLEWQLKISRTFTGMLETEILFVSDTYNDGEKKLIPVLSLMDSNFLLGGSARIPAGAETEFIPEALNNIRNRPGAILDGFSVEVTPNPAWIALKVLPATKPQTDASTTEIATFYSTMILATWLKDAIPNFQSVLDSWAADTSALFSELEKNEDLKATILEMTPWVLEAERERIQRQSLIALFSDLNNTPNWTYWRTQLQNRQMSSGGFTWFPGGFESTFITALVVDMIGQFQQRDLIPIHEISAVTQMMRQAVRYLDRQLELDYETLRAKMNHNPQDQHITSDHTHRLYVRSLFSNFPTAEASKAAYQFYYNQTVLHAHKLPLGTQALASLSLFNTGKKQEASKFALMLKEQSHTSSSRGMYWQTANAYQWHEQSLLTHARVMQALRLIQFNQKDQDNMIEWLFDHKQTNPWTDGNGIINALLAITDVVGDEIYEQPNIEIEMNGVKLPVSKVEAGSGQFTLHLLPAKLPEGQLKIAIKNKGNNKAWFTWQVRYRESMDEVKAGGSETMEINKEHLLLQQQKGKIIALTADTFRLAGQLMVRLHLKTNRSLSYVHIRDQRAAGFEPAILKSGYHYSEGLHYYLQSTDTKTDFFISHMNPGTYILEYPLHIFHRGNFSSGVAQIQSYYLPSISSHSAGTRITVNE